MRERPQAMRPVYGEQHRALQIDFNTTALADAVESFIVVDEIPPEHQAFIESRDMFFLSTVDHRGFHTCSYKGSHPGFVRVVDSKTMTFPSFDGNGMFLSMGNMRRLPR